MSAPASFDLTEFLPYALNRAADKLSLEFQGAYKDRYGMLRTEWRVLFHLGQYGPMTAKEICARAGLHKTKVSRAVAALEAKRFLIRAEDMRDRRHETLSLTRQGDTAFADLSDQARAFDEKIRAGLSAEEADVLLRVVKRIAGLEGHAASH